MPEAAHRPPPNGGWLLEFSPEPLAGPEGEVRVSSSGLWLAALGGPVAWALHLMSMYPLVEVACRFRTDVPLYGMSALMFGAAALAALMNWRYLSYMRERDGSTPARRVRFMATAGLLGCALFMLVIVAGTLPVLFSDPCQLQGRRVPSLIPFL